MTIFDNHKTLYNYPVEKTIQELNEGKENTMKLSRKRVSLSLRVQNNPGCQYEEGAGVPQDDIMEVEWYTKAAKQEHEDAQKALNRLKDQ